MGFPLEDVYQTKMFINQDVYQANKDKKSFVLVKAQC